VIQIEQLPAKGVKGAMGEQTEEWSEARQK
jgi:hypothetical protein